MSSRKQRRMVLESLAYCAVGAADDPEQTFLAMQQEREYAGSLMLVTSRWAIAYVSS